MARNDCDWCCNVQEIVRNELSFRTAMIEILCEIATSEAAITENVNLTQVGGVAVSLGQKAMAASLPVVIASDQSALPTNLTQVAGVPIAQGHGLAATAIRVELPTDGTGVVGLAAGSAIVGQVSINQTTSGTTNNVTIGVNGTTAGNSPIRFEDSSFANLEAVMVAGAVNNRNYTAFNTTNQDVTPVAVGEFGNVLCTLTHDANFAGTISPIRQEDTAFSASNAVMMGGQQRQDTPANNTDTDLDVVPFKCNAEGYHYVDTVRRNTMTHTQPTVTNTTSFTLAAAATQRKYLFVQNNSAANIMINLNNGTLTGIVPTSTNLGIVIPPGGFYETPPNFSPTAAVTVYQSSGGSINTISVIEGL